MVGEVCWHVNNGFYFLCEEGMIRVLNKDLKKEEKFEISVWEEWRGEVALGAVLVDQAGINNWEFVVSTNSLTIASGLKISI